MQRMIDQLQYLQIVGLLALAKRSMHRLNDIELSIRSILDVTKEDEGISGIGSPEHIGDAIYSEYSVDELMEKLGISCEKVHNVGL